MSKVSVIIPTRNRAEYLPGAIMSVLNQTFQDFELIVVDDASSDNTVEVVHSFSDDRITLIRHPRQKGGAAARNTGISHSTSDYIALLDDDDEWLPEKLTLQFRKLRNASPSIGGIYTGYLVINRSNGEIRSRVTPSQKGDLSKALLMTNCLGAAGSSILLRRECFLQAGKFDEELPSFQDYDLWIRISKIFQFDCLPNALIKMYLHDNKISTNLEAQIRGMELMLKKHGSARSLKKCFSIKYLGVAVSYSECGKLREARECYLKAIRLYPFEMRHYFNLGLSFLGTKGFKDVKRWLPTRKSSATARSVTL